VEEKNNKQNIELLGGVLFKKRIKMWCDFHLIYWFIHNLKKQ